MWFTYLFKNLIPLQITAEMKMSPRYSIAISPILFAIFSEVEFLSLRSLHPWKIFSLDFLSTREGEYFKLLQETVWVLQRNTAIAYSPFHLDTSYHSCSYNNRFLAICIVSLYVLFPDTFFVVKRGYSFLVNDFWQS